mmetsp:Transcript_18284/g.59020  ORF Transcript_18284/g.59020 Transcript_18284/m.59020 type:complete len:220 (+) Transcript_18284:726-1385(+)
MSNQYVTTASFDILDSRPEQRRFLVTKALTRLLHPNPYRHDLTAPLHDPASPPAQDDSTLQSADPSTDLPPGDPSTELPPDDVPIPETLGDEEAPSARTRSKTTDLPAPPANLTRANRRPTSATIPSLGTRIEVLWPNHRQTDKKQPNHGSWWWPAIIANDQKDIKIINSDRGVPVPIDECRVILDVSDNNRPYVICICILLCKAKPGAFQFARSDTFV